MSAPAKAPAKAASVPLIAWAFFPAFAARVELLGLERARKGCVGVLSSATLNAFVAAYDVPKAGA